MEIIKQETIIKEEKEIITLTQEEKEIINKAYKILQRVHERADSSARKYSKLAVENICCLLYVGRCDNSDYEIK